MWDWAIWGALIVAVLAGIAALALFLARARKAEATTEKIASAGETAELRESLERMHPSLAQLAVLRAALDEAQGTVGRVTAYLPRK